MTLFFRNPTLSISVYVHEKHAVKLACCHPNKNNNDMITMKQDIEETYLTTHIQTNINVFNIIAGIHIISHTLCNSST